MGKCDEKSGLLKYLTGNLNQKQKKKKKKKKNCWKIGKSRDLSIYKRK